VACMASTGKSGRKFHYYRCKCDKKNEPKEKLEALVVNIATEQIVNSPHLDEWIDYSIKVYNESFGSIDTMIKHIQSEIRKTKSEIDNVVTAIKQGIITASTKTELISLEDRLKSLLNELTLKESLKPSALDHETLKKWFAHASSLDHKDIIEALVKKVVVYDDKIDVSFYLSDRSVSLDTSNAHQIILNANTVISIHPGITISISRQ